ncbi:MAG: TetR family transcriptional regulator [Gordonia sp.]|nr:TetR family transcriptional regulator [Gordonia sp. (in: high G+C Gram-positive bacteria)]
MVRTRNLQTRSMLIERAAQMLRARESVTLRSLVSGTSVSTMAVYTYFDGMDGLWKALRQEGFTRLAARLSDLQMSDDPVRDQTMMGVAYLSNALQNPDLYRVMFDTSADLEDAAAAEASLHHLVIGAERCSSAGRFRSDLDPTALATQQWMIGHGLASLVAGGPLPESALAHAVPMLTALFVSAGDEPSRCARSVESGWAPPG